MGLSQCHTSPFHLIRQKLFAEIASGPIARYRCAQPWSRRMENARYLSRPRFANHQTTREAAGWNRTRSSSSRDTRSEGLLQFATVRPLWLAIPALTEDATPL